MIENFDALIRFFEEHPCIAVLTGAGVSTGSGIPDYRDTRGHWKRPTPVQYHDFVNQPATRRRYWARSLTGWPWFENARPNASHHALATLGRAGYVHQVITQNVDRLHQQAGSVHAIDLHGRLDRIVCLNCDARTPRGPFQEQLADLNPLFKDLKAEFAPDGDAYIGDVDYSSFHVPGCPACGGILKPDVVFFGESVPKDRVDTAMSGMLAADALLVCGSSLMVYSGYRFCRAAAEASLPIAAVNLGRTRADDLLGLKWEARCESILPALAEALTS